MREIPNRLAGALADRYRLERELGQGGMATVYLAHDLRHDRKVALKVLRPELSAILGAERFLTEIKTTANLQHPHILSLFDSGEADGLVYYVMPYVEGESLRDRLAREHQLPVDDAVRIASEVADALQYAHEHGIVHRDIKPENILLHGGHAQVADFGIALAAARSDGGSRMTETGMSLGTPHYMSPEQAMGEREITARSDVYALGCVLYEMLTGDPPFTGSTAQAIVARVMTEHPRSLTSQRHTIPRHVEDAVLTALEKLPADRFATAAEFAAALASPGYTRQASAALVAASPETARWRGVALAAGSVAILCAAVALWAGLRPAPTQPVTRYGLAFAQGQTPTGVVEITPDGSQLVYIGPGDSGARIWVKKRDQYEATPLAGTTGARGPSISPDGKWIAYEQQGKLKKSPIGGGGAITLADSAFYGSAAWLEDGTLVFTSLRFTLMRVPAAGGNAAEVQRAPDTARSHASVLPTPLPDTRGVLFTECTTNCVDADLWVLDLKSGASRELLPGALRGWYLPTRDLVYVRRDGGMFAVPFDLGSLKIRGTPVPVLNNIALRGGIIPVVTTSSAGTLVMQIGTATGSQPDRYDLVWLNRSGARTPLDTSWSFRLSVAGGNEGWALSPDGTRLAIGLNTDAGDHIWIRQLPTGPLSRLTFDSLAQQRPRWTPDGKSVTYIVPRTNSLNQRRADGTGTEQVLLRFPGNVTEGFWSHDGQWLVVRKGGNVGQAGGRDIFGLRRGADTTLVPLAANPGFDESAPALSPDGRWLAYESDETGKTEVYIRPFPNTEAGKWQVSTNGGQAPLWSHSGRELFFVDGARNMVVATVAGGPTPGLGARRTLFRLGDDLYLSNAEHYTPFDISHDDTRFLMARRVTAAQQATPTFLLVENWFEELKARAGTK